MSDQQTGSCPSPPSVGSALGSFAPMRRASWGDLKGLPLSVVRQHPLGWVHHQFYGDGEMEEVREGYGVRLALMGLAGCC